MAFKAACARFLGGSSSTMPSRFHPVRCLCSQLTSPKLCIAGLPSSTTENRLKEVFAPFGNLVETKLDVDGATGQSTGCGFVEYDTIEAAEKARKAMHCRFLDRWIISVEPAKE